MQLVSWRKLLCCSDDSSGTGISTVSSVDGGDCLLGSFISSGFPLVDPTDVPSSTGVRRRQSACLGIVGVPVAHLGRCPMPPTWIARCKTDTTRLVQHARMYLITLRSVLYSVLSVCVCEGAVTTITRNCVHRSSPNWDCR